jgi:hypothetical protein
MSFNIIQIQGYKKAVEINFIKNNFRETDKQPSLTNSLLEYEYLYPASITNTVIDIKDEVFLFDELNHIFSHLEGLQCKHIVINFICGISNELLVFLFKQLNSFNIHEALILANYCDYLYSEEFSKTVFLTDRYKSFFIFNAPFDKNLEDLFFYSKKPRVINYNKQKDEFNINKVLYSESITHHTYFNKKLYIGPSGEIKNAPETAEVFGYIQDIKSEEELQEIISTPDFQKYWFIHKDLIDVCKECEFRHMCVDNRVPIKRAKDEWFHMIECNYNPYIAKWAGEEGYQTLEECGVISNESGFSIDHEKIKQINLKLETESS